MNAEALFAIHDEKELARLPIAGVQDVLMVRLVARQEAARLGFTPQAITRIATAVSEIARNVVQHAGAPGQVRIFESNENGPAGLKIVVDDQGRGIADLERALAGASPGSGIPGSRKLMDGFAIRSRPGVGTEVAMVKWSGKNEAG